MPMKTVTICSRDAPWFTKELRHLIKQRNKIHKKAKRTDSPQDLKQFHRLEIKLLNK